MDVGRALAAEGKLQGLHHVRRVHLGVGDFHARVLGGELLPDLLMQRHERSELVPPLDGLGGLREGGTP